MIRNCLTVSDTAARLGCSTRQVFKYLQRGILERGHSLGRETLVTMVSITKFESAIAPEPALPERPRIAYSVADEHDAVVEALSDFRKRLLTEV